MGKEMDEEEYKNLSLMFNQISSEMITDQQNMEQIKHDFAKTGAILYAAYEAFIEAGFSKMDSIKLVSNILVTSMTAGGNRNG